MGRGTDEQGGGARARLLWWRRNRGLQAGRRRGAVAEVAVAMRGKKPPTSQSVVFNIVKAYLVDTEHELLFREEAQEGKAELGPWKEKKLQDWFYRQLLSHPKLNGAGNQGALDTTGAKWMTAKGLFAT